MRTDAEYARQLDAENEIACLRDLFVVDDADLIYLDGNSLGRLPKASVERIYETVRKEWGSRLVGGWNEGWYEAPQRVGAKIAQMIGASPDEVLVCDSTSVNLFKLVMAALKDRPGRSKVVTDDLNFPSDVYIMHGAVKLVSGNRRLEIVRSDDGITVPIEQLKGALDQDTALLALSHTAFKSGFTYDMAQVTELAHQQGALVLWDLCHSVGVVPIFLNNAQVDLAVGCTYKYLSGGPGSPAFLYVRRDHQDRLLNPIAGWFGQQHQFDFSLDYEPASGIRRFLSGTPPILSLAALESSVDIILNVQVERLRALSVRQSEYLIGLRDELLEPLGVKLKSPRDSRCRGSHVSLGHPQGYAVARALIQDMRVVPDFREPDNIRLGLSPLYTTFSEIHEGINRMRLVLADKLYERYEMERLEVT